MSLRRAGLTALVVLAGLALSPAAAANAAPATHSKSPSVSSHKPAKLAHVNGVVTSIDPVGGTIVLTTNGKAQLSVTVDVPSTATIELDDATATLTDIAVGDDVNAKGSLNAGALTAVRVNASSPDTSSD